MYIIVQEKMSINGLCNTLRINRSLNCNMWNIADYVMWIPLAAMDVFFACFCVFNKLWQYIPVLCMVIAVLEFLPYYVFVARLGENVVTKYIISCLEDKDR